MATLDNVRYASDLALSVPGSAALGMRLYTVQLVATQWSGSRPGLGTKTQTTQTLTNANGSNVRVRQVSQNDVVLSGGILRDQDLAVGPIVLPYTTQLASGGIDIATFQPALASSVMEIYYRVTGPGMAADGNQFEKIYEVSDHVTMYRIYLRGSG